MPACLSCSAEVPAGSRFCPACGRALEEQAAAHPTTLVAGSSVLTTSAAPGMQTSSAAIDHGQFVPGTIVVERYRIVGLLGKGGMGEVYRADDLKLGQSVALKFLPRALASDERRLERFHNEVRIARQVAHPNVCRVYDIGDIDGQPFISMEYIDGEDLSSLLRRIGRLPRSKALEIARQMCAGLSAAHERGILHRDLKPMNIMIDGRGMVRITDFGLAALADEATGRELRAGTPAYMAPEQLLGTGVSIRSDLYSLGLVLYEAFTGRKAFEAQTVDELKRLHAESAPASPGRVIDGFDPAIERVLLHCLERDPRERPPSALAVVAALPGGDPLAAALAAGETPSPELVAAAAHAEGIPPTVCLACLLVILLGIFAFPSLNDQVKLHSIARLEKEPAVLADRARQILRRFGLAQRPADEAFGFQVNNRYLSRVEELDDSSTRWSALAAGGPPPIEFWYRQSPRLMMPTSDAGRVTPDDPPPLTPGMASVRLDTLGRLREYFVRPPAGDSIGPTSAPDEWWTALLEEAGLSSERWTPATPSWLPPAFCDTRVAWVGVYPDNPEIPLRVEAAAYHGSPVFFRVAPDWPDAVADLAVEQTAAAAGRVLNAVAFVAALIGSVLLVRRNLSLGRGDRRGAYRISIFVASALMLTWLLTAHHAPDAGAELTLFVRAAGSTLVTAGMCWLLYIALEPTVRRRWPDMLISWSRLLRGRFRDPLLGRDILIGGLFGIFAMVLTAARHFGPGWFGSPPPRPGTVPESTYLGLRFDLAELLNLATTALFQPMLLLVLLLLLLVALRKRWAALLSFYVLLTGVLTLVTIQAGGDPRVNLAFYGLLVAALLFVLLRFGLLALMIALFYALTLNRFPITADLHAWYRDGSFFALAVVGGLTIYGYITALAGRSLWAAPLLPKSAA